MKRQLTLILLLLALAAGVTASAGSAASFNDSAPCPASGPLLVCPTMQVGQSVHLQLLGLNGCDIYRWEMVNGGLPLGLSMSSSGLVTGTPTRAEQTKPWVIIHDLTAPEGGPSWCGGDNHSERQFVFTVGGDSGGTPPPPPPPPPAPPQLQVTSATLATATTGSGYAAQLTASGGNSYSWALSSGSLPAGLELAASGRLSGTPTSAGSYSFGVRVTDEKGRTATGSIALRVLEQLAAIAPADQQWEVGRPLEIPIQGRGGVPAYHWSLSGALPKNTAFIDYEGDGTTVRLHGVPSEEGTFPLTLTMTDSAGHRAQVQLTLTVLPKLQLRTFDPGRATVGKRYQLKLSSGGGVGQLSWAVAKGSLPSGLALDPTSGVISGKPRLRGTYRFTVTVTDALGAKASMTFSLLVRRPPLKR
jgi:large repetitive protein